MALTESMECDLLFYTNPMSRGQMVRWMLEESGATYRQILVSYGEEMNSPEYLAINPMAKVPAITHRGQVVTECSAICAYLADAFPEASLAPSLKDRAAYYRWLFFAAGPVESAMMDRALKVEFSEEMQRTVGYGSYQRMLDVLAYAVSRTNYVAGDRFTAADVYLGAQLIWGLEFGSVESRPEFEDYTVRLKERPAYQAARAIDAALIEAAE